jgi:hypothetical protein
MTTCGTMTATSGFPEESPKAKENTRKTPAGWISEGLLIAAIPTVGYGLALTYELGYLEHFGIPQDLVKVDSSQILLACGVVLGVLAVLYNWCNIAYILAPRVPLSDPIVRCVLRTAPFAVVVGALWICYGDRWRYFYWAVLWLAAVLLLEFVLPLLTQYRARGYRAKLIAQEERERRTHALGEVTLAKAIARHGLKPLVLLGFLFLAFLVAFSSGHAYALGRRIYPVQTSRDGYAIVRIYGDTVISVKYNAESHKLSGDILVETIRRDSPLTFLQKEIGPLSRNHTRSGSMRR